MSGPIKWHGGKAYLAKKIIELFPPRESWLHYVEPYFGGGAVLLQNDPEGVSEVANDINSVLANFWLALQTDHYDTLTRQLEATPFSEAAWRKAKFHLIEPKDFMPDMAAAANFFIACRQSLAGRMKCFTAITKTRVRRGMNNEVSAWWTAIEGLTEVRKRLSRVLILSREAKDVIQQQDGPQTLFYLDPPYLAETRTSPKCYDWEMDDNDHQELLAILQHVKGRFLLSGYRSKLYDDAALESGWKRHDFETPNHAAGGATKRTMTECVWTNY